MERIRFLSNVGLGSGQVFGQSLINLNRLDKEKTQELDWF
ncbi:uncharacterized protein G2W53_032448 [Senna tora]|uniref:Uncharacterized protein n=1 Tax=Senna tora TaxID=362788 RepID=A0A834T0H9_9FABA|nr:uncharacterized protein G2W53_032448 [Senna tora]